MLLTSPWNHCIPKSPWLPCANYGHHQIAKLRWPSTHFHLNGAHSALSLSVSLSLSSLFLYSLSVFPSQASHEAHSEKLNYSHTFLCPSSVDTQHPHPPPPLAFIHLFSHLSEVHLDPPLGHMIHQRLVRAIKYLKILL